jgi:hypothetical protein
MPCLLDRGRIININWVSVKLWGFPVKYYEGVSL